MVAGSGQLADQCQRRRRITADKHRELALAASALRIKVDREPISIIALDDIAARHSSTTYDASYLELALRRRPPLAMRYKALL